MSHESVWWTGLIKFVLLKRGRLWGNNYCLSIVWETQFRVQVYDLYNILKVNCQFVSFFKSSIALLRTWRGRHSWESFSLQVIKLTTQGKGSHAWTITWSRHQVSNFAKLATLPSGRPCNNNSNKFGYVNTNSSENAIYSSKQCLSIYFIFLTEKYIQWRLNLYLGPNNYEPACQV